MEERKANFLLWIKRHKKELTLAGVSITTLIFLTIGVKNRKELETTISRTLEKVNLKSQSSQKLQTANVKKDEVTNLVLIVDRPQKVIFKAPHDVNEHVRNLPKGSCASAEKIASAMEHGFELGERQTWVESYRTKGGVA